MSSVKVAVRVRPFNEREIKNNSQCCIRMDGKTTTIEPPQPAYQRSGKEYTSRNFQFDYSYWSHTSPDDPQFATQERVYEDIGQEMLNHAFDGYNVCIFAYGQTGSGKSYTMMGGKKGDDGIIPRLCNDLFDRIGQARTADDTIEFTVEVSYIEIYCEHVRDLLNPRSKENLPIRQNNILGIYVEDLSKLTVDSYDDIKKLIDIGNKARTVAATNMNETSSRSHAVFTIMFSQKKFDKASRLDCEHASKINLVDLAGSERADSTGATGARLKEGANINKSLTTLGKVITALADLAGDMQASQTSASGRKSALRKKEVYVPYRDSVLTRLLAESLGGNSKTAMIAALSPADINYEETMSTLRYADRAKQIMCKAVVNEDPTQRLIRELTAEVQMLRAVEAEYRKNQVGSTADSVSILTRQVGTSPDIGTSSTFGAENIIVSSATDVSADAMVDSAFSKRLQQTEKLLSDFQVPKEERLQQTHNVFEEHQQLFQEMGVAVGKDGMQLGLFSPKNTPHLVNLNEDELMSECLLYYLKNGMTRVGSQEHQEIQLNGLQILPQHCVFHNNDDGMDVSIEPCSGEAKCYVNGRQILERVPLRTGSRIILGINHVFRFINPMQARSEQQKHRSTTSIPASIATTPLSAETPAGSSAGTVDWTFAQNELLSKQGIDLKGEMNKRIMAMEEELQKQKQEAAQAIVDQKREYEARIDLLQRQVNSQSLIMSQSMHSLADLQQYDGMFTGDMTTSMLSVKSSIAAPLSSTAATTPTGGNAAPYYSPLDSDQHFDIANRFALQWRSYRFNSIRNALWSNAPLLKEANAVSVELGRSLRFQFELLRNTPYTPLPDEFQHMVQMSLKRFNNQKTDFFQPTSATVVEAQQNHLGSRLHTASTVLAIRVYDMNNFGTVVYWSLNRLRQRLAAMKEIYEREVDASERRARRWQLNSMGGSSEPETDLLAEDIHSAVPASSVNNAGVHQTLSAGGTLELALQQSSSLSYFPIGRALVYLTHLLYNETLIQKVPVVDIAGNVCAFLTVCVEIDGEKSSDVSRTNGNVRQHRLENKNSGIKLTFLATTSSPTDGTSETDENVSGIDSNSDHLPAENVGLVTMDGARTGSVNTANNEFNKPYALSTNVALRSATTNNEDGQTHKTSTPHQILQRFRLNEEAGLCITLLQAHGVGRRFSECFCQFHFLNQSNDAFVTEVAKPNEDDNVPVNFFHSQHIRVKLSDDCLNYLATYPIVFELHGRLRPNILPPQLSPSMLGSFLQQQQHQRPFDSGRAENFLQSFPPLIQESPNTEAEIMFQKSTHIPKRFRWPVGSTNIISRPVSNLRETNTTSDAVAKTNGNQSKVNFQQPQQPTDQGTDVYDKYDLIVNFEIRELASNGEYVAAVVDHSDGVPCGGSYILHQGMQRRIVITIAHEKGVELGWTQVRELLVGRVRLVRDVDEQNQLEGQQAASATANRRLPSRSMSYTGGNEPPICEGAVISLSLFPGQYLSKPDDERIFYRFEAVWDSTLHNSSSLNRLSAYGEKIVITATAYVAIKDCATPAVISKDLSLVVYDRSSRATATNYRSTFRNLLFAKPDDQSRVIGIYELTLRTARELRDAFGRVYHPHMIDDQHATSIYVRGEENLHGWKPRGDSLLFEHRWVQEKIRRILMVEQTKHVLRLRSLLTGGTDFPTALIDATGVPTKSEAEANRPLTPLEQTLVQKYIELMRWQLPTALTMVVLQHQSHFGRAAPTSSSSMQPPRSTAFQRTVSPRAQQHSPTSDEENVAHNNNDLLSVSFYSLSSAFASSMDNLVAMAGDSPGPAKSSSSSDSGGAGANGEGKRSTGGTNEGVTKMQKKTSKNLKSASARDAKRTKTSKFIVDIKEARINPMVTKKGWLNFLDTKSNGWTRRWVIVRRPYALLYKSENDMVERALVNLATARIEYGKERDELLRIPNVICVCTPHRGFLMQAESAREVEEWLYAMNPLAVGQVIFHWSVCFTKSRRSTMARSKSSNDLLEEEEAI